MPTNQGLKLDRYLSEKGPLDPARVIRIGIQIAQQMGSLSGSFLIHPGRILATKEGTVHLLPPPAEDLALPAMVELPAYASPEEIQGGQPDVRAGLYSLGCTLFELLAGTPPFSGKDPKGVLRAHLEDPVPDIRDLTEGVSASLAETLSELLEKNPELRIQTPQELIRRLKQGLSTDPQPGGSLRPSRSPAHGASVRPLSGPAARPLSAASSHGAAARGPRPMSPAQRSTGHHGMERASKLRPPAHLGAGTRGRSLAAGEYDDGPRADLVVVRKKAYPFTIGGAALGLLIGIALVLAKVRAAREEIPEREQKILEEAKAEALKTRKETFAAEQKEKKDAVAKQLQRFKTVPDAEKWDFLEQALPGLCDLPSGHLLGKALLDLGPRPGTAGSTTILPEEAEVTAAYKKQKEEAEALHAQGKIGDAIEKIYDNFQEYKAHHGPEIDGFVEKWSDELTAKWKAAVVESERLLLKADTSKALGVLKEALEYGDGPIRKEAQQRIESIQTQVAISQDEGTKTEDEGMTELEKEFEQQSEGEGSEGSEESPSESGEGAGQDEGMGPAEGPGTDEGSDPEETVGGEDPGGNESGEDF